MSRLPQVGGDNNDWGSVLNDYLSVSLDTDGSIKASAIATKVDKVTGKALSTNDFDTTYKSSVDFTVTTTISYTTAIPFTRSLTIITGKTLITNDVITIASSPVEGAGAQMVLVGDGTHSPDLTACDYISGSYDSTTGVNNLLTFEYIGAKVWISILNGTAI